MECPRAVLFDLDDTLAPSFKPPAKIIVEKFANLLDFIPLSIITAADFHRIERDFLESLEHRSSITQLYIFPNSSAECYVFQNGWSKVYDFQLADKDRQSIREAILESVRETRLELNPKYAPIIIDDNSQIRYAALGLSATDEDKKQWDPDKKKRWKLKLSIEEKLKNFEVLIGGRTTIDITPRGVTKAYGVEWLANRLKIAPSDMLYVGDAFYDGGNDGVVKPTGVQIRSVTGPLETQKVIEELLTVCAK